MVAHSHQRGGKKRVFANDEVGGSIPPWLNSLRLLRKLRLGKPRRKSIVRSKAEAAGRSPKGWEDGLRQATGLRAVPSSYFPLETGGRSMKLATPSRNRCGCSAIAISRWSRWLASPGLERHIVKSLPLDHGDRARDRKSA